MGSGSPYPPGSPGNPSTGQGGPRPHPSPVPSAISANGLRLIESFEGFRPYVYTDSGGKPTIGYGHLVTPGESYPSGITVDEAITLMDKDLSGTEMAIRNLVKVPLNQNQFDALVSFTYNVGSGNFANSTLLKQLNTGDYASAAADMLQWVYAGNSISAGLKRRREQENALFLKPIDDELD